MLHSACGTPNHLAGRHNPRIKASDVIIVVIVPTTQPFQPEEGLRRRLGPVAPILGEEFTRFIFDDSRECVMFYRKPNEITANGYDSKLNRMVVGIGATIENLTITRLGCCVCRAVEVSVSYIKKLCS
jgi:hypothetical protein